MLNTPRGAPLANGPVVPHFYTSHSSRDRAGPKSAHRPRTLPSDRVAPSVFLSWASYQILESYRPSNLKAGAVEQVPRVLHRAVRYETGTGDFVPNGTMKHAGARSTTAPAARKHQSATRPVFPRFVSIWQKRWANKIWHFC